MRGASSEQRRIPPQRGSGDAAGRGPEGLPAAAAGAARARAEPAGHRAAGGVRLAAVPGAAGPRRRAHHRLGLPADRRPGARCGAEPALHPACRRQRQAPRGPGLLGQGPAGEHRGGGERRARGRVHGGDDPAGEQERPAAGADRAHEALERRTRGPLPAAGELPQAGRDHRGLEDRPARDQAAAFLRPGRRGRRPVPGTWGGRRPRRRTRIP